MASISKAEKKAQRLERREARRQAAGEIMDSRMRTAVGFGVAYLGTQVLPSLAPSMAEYQSTLDLALAGVSAYVALTDDGELGDYAVGAGLVGLTQTLDNIGTRIQAFLA